jgi:hypothetical protein
VAAQVDGQHAQALRAQGAQQALVGHGVEAVGVQKQDVVPARVGAPFQRGDLAAAARGVQRELTAAKDGVCVRHGVRGEPGK